MVISKNYYDLLGVSKESPDEVIKAAYKAMAKKYHPDTYNGDHEFAEKTMKDINTAYSVLINRTERDKYDEELSQKEEKVNLNKQGDSSQSSAYDNRQYNAEENYTNYSSQQNNSRYRYSYEKTENNKYEDNLKQNVNYSGNSTNANTQQYNSSVYTGNGEKKSIGCGGIIVIVILVCVIASWIKGNIDNNNNSSTTSNSESATASIATSNTLNDPKKPEYWANQFVKAFKEGFNTVESDVDFIDNEMLQKMDSYLNNASAIIAQDDFVNQFPISLDDSMAAEIDKNTYTISSAEYIDAKSAKINITISYTDIQVLANEAYTYAWKESAEYVGMDLSLMYFQYFNEYLRSNYRSKLGKAEVKVVVTLTEQANCWQIVDCDNYKAFIGSVTSGLTDLVGSMYNIDTKSNSSDNNTDTDILYNDYYAESYDEYYVESYDEYYAESYDEYWY